MGFRGMRPIWRIATLGIAALAGALSFMTPSAAASGYDSAIGSLYEPFSGVCMTNGVANSPVVLNTGGGCDHALQWVYIGIGSDGQRYWHIVDDGTGLCITAASTDNHAGIVMKTCSSNWLSYWRGDVTYTDSFGLVGFNIINRMSLKCIALQGTTPGTAAFLWPCNHSYTDQTFSLSAPNNPAGSGWYPGWVPTTPV